MAWVITPEQSMQYIKFFIIYSYTISMLFIIFMAIALKDVIIKCKRWFTKGGYAHIITPNGRMEEFFVNINKKQFTVKIGGKNHDFNIVPSLQYHYKGKPGQAYHHSCPDPVDLSNPKWFVWKEIITEKLDDSGNIEYAKNGKAIMTKKSIPEPTTPLHPADWNQGTVLAVQAGKMQLMRSLWFWLLIIGIIILIVQIGGIAYNAVAFKQLAVAAAKETVIIPTG